MTVHSIMEMIYFLTVTRIKKNDSYIIQCLLFNLFVTFFFLMKHWHTKEPEKYK